MIKWILTKIVGSKNEREIKRLTPIVAKINELEEAYQAEPEENNIKRVQTWQKHLHRYLPLEVTSQRFLQTTELQEVELISTQLNDRFDSLREEFPSLPEVESSPESIDAAYNAFREIESQFLDKTAAYLETILPEALAVVKNTARRMCGEMVIVNEQELAWNMVHFDVQLIGGMALHKGLISEMQTGEGKTLVATLPVFLNALTGLGVHVITVNDYLAKRDSDWMGSLFKRLGLTVGCLQSQQLPHLRKEEYNCDITYGTNSEFGFDYLRDNGMANSKEEQVQRGHYFAVIDEVDSVLIDEARTPLIISGPSDHSSIEQYQVHRNSISELVKKQRSLCNELANDVKKLLEEGDEENAGKALFKVKLGDPKSRQLARMMQEPEYRRLIDATELSLYQDAQKKKLYELKEELFYTIDEKAHDADLMEKGRETLSPEDPDAFVLPDIATIVGNIEADDTLSEEEKTEKRSDINQLMQEQGLRVHAISQLLKAYCIYEKDIEYVVEEGKVMIIDQQTGRKMAGRRWSDGLHQAVEAKENVAVEEETQTYATITIQNYFRLYHKLGGMTGTAETEAAEFHDIYKLDVLPIPTNVENKRIDLNDQVFKSRREKYNAVVNKIQECRETGQPVLVGTASVEASETLSRLLKRSKIEHNVLNAKFHEAEADIIAAAGQKGAVTVSTNMAGRGTDIKLAEGVEELGGLMVIGCERYESRRVDRQLRGRCARQGDSGMSQFYISFEDNLMRNFGAAQRMTTMMERMGMDDGEALEHKWLNRSIETAQRRVEQRDYRGRKTVLEFDDVMNQQRTVVYGYRNEVIHSENPRDLIDELINEVIPAKVFHYLEERDDQRPDYAELLNWVNITVPLNLTIEESKFQERSTDENIEYLKLKTQEAYEEKILNEDPALLDGLERHIILSGIDKQWKEHLYNMDALREGISLRAQGQKDPLIEYKNEAFKIFSTLMDAIKEEAVNNLFRITTKPQSQFASILEQLGLPEDMTEEQFQQFLEEHQKNELEAEPVEESPQGNLPVASPNGPIPLPENEVVKITIPKRKPIQLGKKK